MKRHAIALAVGVALGLFSVFPVGAASDSIEADVAAIQEIWKTYESTRVSADAETWLELWDKDALKMSQGKPTQTYADMEKGAPKKFVPGSLAAMEINAEEIVVLGDWAFSSGNYSADPVKDGKTLHFEGKFLTVFKRQDDGSWKIYRVSASMNN